MPKLQRNDFKVKLFQKATGLANHLAALPNRLLPAPFRLIQMGSAFWQSRALATAAELGVADTLGDAEMSSAELAAELHLHEDHLYRLLRMLASSGVFEERMERRFLNNRLSACLRRDHPRSVRAIILMHNAPEMSRPWFESFTPAVRSGEVPFVLTHGQELFPYMDNHPQLDALFTEAMEAVEGLTGSDYLRDFDWSRFDRLIDVGGSNGRKSIAILQQTPQLRALVFDRPPVVADATNYWRDKVSPSLLERIEFRGGDIFEAIPPARSDNDLYLFVAVFHGMGDEEVKRVLGNLKFACGDHRPTLVIADAVARVHKIDPTIASLDLQMLVNTRGRERTLSEWRQLLAATGFDIQEVVDVRAFARFLVARLAA